MQSCNLVFVPSTFLAFVPSCYRGFRSGHNLIILKIIVQTIFIPLSRALLGAIRFKIQNSKFKISDSKFQIQNACFTINLQPLALSEIEGLTFNGQPSTNKM